MQSMIGKTHRCAAAVVRAHGTPAVLSDGETLRQLRLGEQQLFERMVQTLLDPKQFSLANMQF